IQFSFVSRGNPIAVIKVLCHRSPGASFYLSTILGCEEHVQKKPAHLFIWKKLFGGQADHTAHEIEPDQIRLKCRIERVQLGLEYRQDVALEVNIVAHVANRPPFLWPAE